MSDVAEVSDGSEVDTRSPFLRLLTTRGFLALFVSNTLGFGGEQMRLTAQSWWILDEGGTDLPPIALPLIISDLRPAEA
ncbi:MAG: hypothetical protein HON31_02900 [Chloroflexi bacterium]|nr:hypothetical protein [Chloroflexota bacterium]